MMKDIVIVIPALNPDEKMIKLIKELSEQGYINIIVVNDGSSAEYDTYFRQVEDMGYIVFKHYKNMGKGRALKNAFNYILNQYPNTLGVITADSDGQHTINDIKKCTQLLQKHSNEKKLFLGVRNFNTGGIPVRSRYGNKITCKILNIFCGINISDTQTGLRGITKAALVYMLDLVGERYEYEMNMIIETNEHSIEIEEFPIETIYIDDNASSHFNPILDSYRIYKQFFKYIISSVSSFIIDILLFSILTFLLKNNEIENYILISTYGARVVSATYNFFMNKKMVFKNDGQLLITGMKYVLLCIIQGTLSGVLVNALCMTTHLLEVICKIIVDSLLFFVSFFIQKSLVFTGGKKQC